MSSVPTTNTGDGSDEFDLIARYFSRVGTHRDEVILGQGDDAALLNVGSQTMAVCTDTMVAGRHFVPGQSAFDVGFKCLAVNLSDLAAMGAKPLWAMLNLTHPDGNEDWIAEYCRGFNELACLHNVTLIGGDTTRGPLNVGVSVGGLVSGQPLLRSAALPGHAVFLSGDIGDGAVGLAMQKRQYAGNEQDRAYCLDRLHRPRPHLFESDYVSRFAHSAIDVSDGLIADLGHILEMSKVGAELDAHRLPLSDATSRYLEATGDLSGLLTGGDDYVLCFCVSEDDIDTLMQAKPESMKLTRIGKITREVGKLDVKDHHGELLTISGKGFNHFDS